SVEISDLNASLQEKVLVITALKDELRKLKGKALVDNAVMKHTINSETLKIDVEPITHKLLNKKTAHSAYIKHTQEEAAVLRNLGEHVKSNYPLDHSLESSCRYTKRIQKLLTNISKTCPSINNSGEKLMAVSPKNKEKELDSLSQSHPQETQKQPLHQTYVVFYRIEAHPRTVKSSLKNKNSVVEPKGTANVQHSKLNANSKLLCVKITTTTEVPLKKPIALENETPKPVVTLVYSRKPRKSKTNIHVSKSKVVQIVLCVNGKEVHLVIVDDTHDLTLGKVLEVKKMKYRFHNQVSQDDPKAVATACYTQNRSIIRLRHDKTPYDLLHDKLPDLSFFYVFCALCYLTNDSENLGKLQPKADIGIFIGYAPTKKAFRIYNRRTRQIIETIHVDFDDADRQLASENTTKTIQASSSLDAIPTVVHTAAPNSEHVTKWTKDHPLDNIIGLQISQSLRGIFINQSKYALESLKNIGMESSNPVDTLIVEKSKLDEDTQGKSVNPTHYHRMVDTFCISTSDRLSFNVCVCALGKRLVSWSSKRQKSVAISSTEAEYIALSRCCAQVLWMRSQLTDYGLGFNKIPIYCDNKSVIALCCNNVQHSRSKHIDIRFHFIKEQVENGITRVGINSKNAIRTFVNATIVMDGINLNSLGFQIGRDGEIGAGKEKTRPTGPYVFKNFIPGGSTIPRFQTIKDLDGEDLSLHDVEMEQDDVHNNSEDPLVSAMLLLAKAITQNFSNPTNNRLHASSNTRNQAIIQGDRRTRIAQRTLRTPSSGNTSTVQCYNCSGKGHYARNCPKPRVRDSKYFMEEMLLAKQEEAGVILTDEQNDFLSFDDASRGRNLKKLSANFMLNGRIPPLFILMMMGQARRLHFIIEYGVICAKIRNLLSSYLEVKDKIGTKVENNGCSKHMTGDRSLLRNFIKKFMGTVRFGMIHFCSNSQAMVIIYTEKWRLFRSITCYIRNLEGDDLLTGGREYNLYTISISDMGASSPVCLMSKATSTSQVMARDDLLVLLVKGKARKLLITKLMKLQRSSRKLNYKAKVYKIRTDNGTEFKNTSLKAHYEKLGIMQQFLIARTPQQNGVVERRNRTLVEAARTMLIFSRLPKFLWAEAVATAYFTQNRSIIYYLSTSSIFVDAHEAPHVVTTSDEQTSPISLTEADEFNQEDSADFDGNAQFVFHYILQVSSISPWEYHKSSQYAIEVVKKHGLDECVSMSIPMVTERLDADLHGTPTDQMTYHRMIGGLMYLTSSRNLLSFGDIYLNGYDTQTTTIENEKYFHIIDKSNVLEKLPMLHSGLHYTHLSMAESHMVIKEKSCDPGIVSLWHDRLGHPGSTMMKRINESTHGHPLKDQKILLMDKMAPCSSCSLGKLISRPSPLKVEKESHVFLERIQGDIYYTVKRIRIDNAGEFTPQAFNDYYSKRMTKSYIPAVNAPAWVEIPDIKTDEKVTQVSKAHLKCGRPVGSKDKNHRKRKATENAIIHEDIVLEGTQNVAPPEKEIDDINKEISINYGHSKISLDQTKTNIIDDKFCYNVACDIMNGNNDPKPTSVIKCQSRHDWNKWKEAMQAELNSLNKRKVFGLIVLTSGVVKPVGYRWVFIRKRNENDAVIRYKARLVAQGFSQRPWDYEEIYSLVMDAIMFRYLISLTVSENIDIRLMDVVTAYLYGSLDSDIYMKIPEGFKMPEALSAKPKDMYFVKLQRYLYGLKQSGCMWCNRLSDYLISKGYKSNLICPCVFIKKTTSRFVIIAVYVDDLNIIGTHKEINEVVVHLKEEFKMKDLGKSLSTPMVGRSLNVDNDPFRPCEEDEDVLGPEVPYLSAIGALMYLTNYTRLDISFAVNLLARFSLSPTKRH
ncbi:retrovirus-related pol polyprotein from transposon TNT 1-94, partial [Tanacetum coccineum]